MWTFGGVRVFVQALPDSLKQIIARLQPVQGGTVHQIFGYESPVFKLKAYIVGQDDKDTLDEFYKDGNVHTLSGYWGIVGDFYVSSMSFDPQPVVYQTLRTDLDCNAQIYVVDMELFQDI